MTLNVEEKMLHSRWIDLCAKLGRNGEPQWTVIRSSYTEADRAYHSLDHIEDCLGEFDENAHLASDAIAVEFAIWFHDLVYDTKASDNEDRSADTAAEFLEDTSVAECVPDLIKATKHDSIRVSSDAALICDIDLSILGRDVVHYQEYSEAIRKEYQWVPEADYASGRAKVLESFLARDHIYFLPSFQHQYERQARSNLQAEIDRLTQPANKSP